MEGEFVMGDGGGLGWEIESQEMIVNRELEESWGISNELEVEKMIESWTGPSYYLAEI